MRLGRFCAPALGLLLATSHASADTPANASLSLGDNAALRYWIASALIPDSPTDVSTIRDWQTVPLDENSAKVVEDCGKSLRYLHLGVQLPQCNWGLEYGEGPDLYLPYLNKNRELAQMACLRSRYEVQQGKSPAAMSDSCDVLTCARQTGQGGILICKLVQYRMEMWGIETIAGGLNRADADSLKRLTNHLDHLPGNDLLVDTLNAEKRLDIDWLIQHIKDAGPNTDLSQTFSVFEGEGAHPTKDDLQSLVNSAGGTGDAVIQKLQDLLTYCDQIASLVSAKLPMNEFNEKYSVLRSQNESNPFAALILPNFRRAYEESIAAQTRIVLLRAATAVVEGGPAALKNFQDPVEHQPFEYEAQQDGFTLTSKIMYRGKPVKLTVGSTD
jgi:hypothetical protein